MNEMQVALLIIGAGVVAGLLIYGRRSTQQRSQPPSAQPVKTSTPSPTVSSTAAFDDFGVSKPRVIGTVEPAPAPATKPKPVAAEPAARPPAKTTVPQKIITLFIAEKEGTKIFGSRIHAALEAQKLHYNDAHKCYDRLDNGGAVFSVTSLTAPGHLDRSKADDFATPGLALFLRLPNPTKPTVALKNLVATADALAKSLNAVLFDADHQPLTNDTLRRLSSDVEDWARKYPG